MTRPNEFFLKLQADPDAFSKTKRVRFGESTRELDFYATLFGEVGDHPEAWHSAGDKRAPAAVDVGAHQLALFSKIVTWGEGAEALSLASTNPLSRLERVVMGSEESVVYDLFAQQRPRLFDRALFPISLVGLYATILTGQVQHYCQRETFSPFALPPATFRCRHPPKTVTFHIPGGFFAHFGDTTKFGPPIVLGTTNRYFFTFPVWSFVADGADIPLHLTHSTIAQLAQPILNMVRRRHVFLVPHHLFDSPTGEDDQSDTILEVYNWTGVVRFPRDPAGERTFGSGTQYLSAIQRYLDEQRQPGQAKVILKPLFEATPCAACDLDLKKDSYLDIVNPRSVPLV